MRVQRNLVQLVTQGRAGGDFLPRAAIIGFPPAVEPLTRLDRAAITVPFVAVATRPAGLRFEFGSKSALFPLFQHPAVGEDRDLGRHALGSRRHGVPTSVGPPRAVVLLRHAVHAIALRFDPVL